jgi:DNA-binding response OmpR family regulator
MPVFTQQSTVSPTHDIPRRPPGVRILFVEDDPDTASAMSRLLTHCGYQVQTAASVDEAVRSWSGGSFDLLISDIGLPDGTGRDILRAISGAEQVRAIVISGHGLDEDVQESRSAGFAEHLVKPVSFQTLEATIRRVTS